MSSVNQCEMQTMALGIEMETNFMLKRNHLHGQDVAEQSTTGNFQLVQTNKRTSLLDLNYDCVRQIFKFLDASALCSIVEACTTTNSTHLKEIAADIFERSRKSWNFVDESVTSIDEIRRIFFNFGSLISEMQIDFVDFSIDAPYKEKDLLDVVIEFCSKTVKSLIIEEYQIPEEQLVALRPLFSNLEKLHFTNVTTEGVGKDLLANCESLVELLIISSNEDNLLVLENVFPKLQRFTYVRYEYLNLKNFLTRHKNLRAIDIRSMDRWTYFMPIIADNCKQLNKLDIRLNNPDENPEKYERAVDSVLKLKHLKDLYIDCNFYSVTKFMQRLKSFKSLECLSIQSALCDSEFMAAIVQLQHIRQLDLDRCYKLTNFNQLGNLTELTNLNVTTWNNENIDFDIVQLIKRLANLKKIIFDCDSFQMDKEAYLKIVNIVQERTVRSNQRLEIGCATDDFQNCEHYRHIVQFHRFRYDY